MGYPVTYYCPHCGTLVELERDGYLSDKAVTPYPFEGWEYVDPDEAFEDGAADGVAFVCGESPPVVPDTDAVESDDEGCGERFYLSFVRFEDGREIDPRRADTDGERVELAEGGGARGPRGPDGPSGPTGGFY
ncbi:hypothetical protein [Halobaculum gomorrense]|uniref:DUF7969 domain-containing protein n=1 Tax=Halobaculum gomorrense TaxID=43928 RepID=A0A1M5SD13_9EURY|nr:hypothetical protein [Halobaculum gomorrense]SHH36396.1 hypothetical protein SAMN05443636_2421 [Halobaculum gomorrense]